MRLTKREVNSYLLRNTVKVVNDQEGVPTPTITRDYDAVTWITGVSDMADALVSRDEALFRVFKTRNGTWSVCYGEGVATRLINAIRYAPAFVKKHYPYHSFDPRVEVFFHLLGLDPLVKECVESGMRGLSEERATRICDHLNDFVTACRTELRSDLFQEQTRRCLRNALKTDRSGNHYVSQLFVRCSRMLVVRVDLYYPSEESGGRYSGLTVNADSLRRDRERFVRMLKRSSFWAHQLGYCWKLEYGLKKGFHYHWLFFFNGARVREDVTIGQLIGQVWESILGGTGLYWNCNAFKDKYTDLGIGMVSASDTTRRFGLRKAIAYLTKPDYHLRLSAPQIERTFGKGILKARMPSRRGRPRRCVANP